MSVSSEVWSAVLGALAGAVVGYWGSIGTQNRQERAAVHAKLTGIKRLLAHLTFSKLEAQVQFDIFQQIRKLRFTAGQDQGEYFQRATEQRDRVDVLNLEIERLKRELFETLARIPFLFREYAAIRKDIDELLELQDGSIGWKTPVRNRTEQQLLVLDDEERPKIKKMAEELIEHPLERICDAIARQLPTSDP